MPVATPKEQANPDPRISGEVMSPDQFSQGVEAAAEVPDPVQERLQEEAIVQPNLAEQLEAVRQRPDVAAATSDYLDENGERINGLEGLLDQMDDVAESTILDDPLERPDNEEFIEELGAELDQLVEDTESFQELQALRDKLAELEATHGQLPKYYATPARRPNSLRTINGRSVHVEASREEMLSAAETLGVKVSSLKFRLSAKYRRRIDEEINARVDEVERQAEAARASVNGKTDYHSTPTSAKAADTPDFTWPPVDLSDLATYPETAAAATSTVQSAVKEAMISDPDLIEALAHLPEDMRKSGTREAIRSALKAIGLQSDEITVGDVAIDQLGVGSSYKGTSRDKLLAKLAYRAKIQAAGLFNETALPAYYTYKDETIINRLNQLTERLNARLRNLEDSQPVNLAEQLRESAEGFVESIDRSSDLYWHATPVLDLIVQSHKLSPRVNVPEDKRVTNTGSHSNAVHFSRGGFDNSRYSTSRHLPDSDPRRRTFKGGQRQPVDGITAVVVPLGVLAKYAPVRYEDAVVAPESSGDSDPTQPRYRDQDVGFYSSTDMDSLFDYDIPLEECFITVSDDISNQTRQLLLANGYSQDWIDRHLVTMQPEMTAGGYHQAEADAYVTRSIKPKLTVEPIVPLRVLNSVYNDGNDGGGWAAAQPRRRTRSATSDKEHAQVLSKI